MSTDLLFEHFATLATAPDGIARLRELILQLAVQGKLGTQDAGDEPANVLLEKIKKEKKQLVKEGKIKRENIIPTTPESESPYPLPKGWKWVTLNDAFLDIRSGGTPSKNNPQFWDGEIYWASVKDLKDKKYLESTQDKITQKGLDECRSKLIPPGNLIICVRMGLGKIAINKVHLAINQDLKAADLSKNIDINYFYNFYRAQTVKGTGMTVDGIRQEKLLQMPFPLPPLAEQHRIVAKVDRLMALCDEVEARQQQERAGCLKLGTASLAGLQNAESPEEFEAKLAQVCDAFDLILDCPENVERLRDTIVTLGCSGKLTETWRTENQNIESASHSLSKLIKARKQKKFLKSNLKQHDFSNFPQIPDTWMWSTIEEVSERVTVGHVGPMMNEYRSTGVPFLRSQNVRKNYFDEKGLVHISQEFHDVLSKSKIEPGDLVVVRSGNVGVCCVIPDTLTDANCSDLVIVKQPFGFLPRFGAYYVNSIAQTWVNSGKVGMALTHFNTKSVANLPIPLPPLAEQHRIVAKVDVLMQLCDALELRLKERAGVQGRLAGAVVRQVAG